MAFSGTYQQEEEPVAPTRFEDIGTQDTMTITYGSKSDCDSCTRRSLDNMRLRVRRHNRRLRS